MQTLYLTQFHEIMRKLEQKLSRFSSMMFGFILFVDLVNESRSKSLFG